MKIAAVTNDGRSISAHFGRATSYLVMTIADGVIVERETRDKAACDHGHHGHSHAQHEQAQSGMVTLTDTASPAVPVSDSHTDAATLIADCDIVLARGMGRGMHAKLQRTGVRAVLTKIVLIEEAVAAYLAGTLEEHPELVH